MLYKLLMKKNYLPLLIIFIIFGLTLYPPFISDESINIKNISASDVSWLLSATAFVLIMTPGLAFFYGGMVSKKNVISTMLQSYVCMIVITVLWVIYGFSLAYGKSLYGIIGNPFDYFMMKGVLSADSISTASTVPLLLYSIYQLKFAIITPALISGSFAERIKFNAFAIFIVLFFTFIYAPLAHMTWHPDGILFKLGVLDFAGGTVVHITAGWAALAGAIFLKKRDEQTHNPSRVTYVLLGTGLLWFGWIGFNAGSAFASNGLAVIALANTTIASAASAFTWLTFDAFKKKKPSAIGLCLGVVVGLVAITPAAGYVGISHSLFIGSLSAIICNIAVNLRSKTNIDDSLDVFPGHGLGGIMGMLLTGVFAYKNINPANTTGNGLYFGETKLFIIQFFTMVGVSFYSFFGSLILLKITNLIIPMRVSKDDEKQGLDISQHGENL